MVYRIPTVAALTIAAGSLLVLSGCLVSSSNTTYETGRRISDQTRAQIEVGRTTGAWLIATLGDPTARRKVEGEAGETIEIWRYDYTERRESDGTVFLLFAGASSSSKTSTTFFELTDGVVSNHWSE